MKNKNFLYVIAILFLVGLSLFIWNNYQIQIQERPDKSIKLPSQISGQCGMESCHGLDITCGSNVPEACDLMYRAGDTCRQFASCQTVKGQCQVELSPRFDNCKSCVEKCEQEFPNGQAEFFECESSCSS